jgi:hypothetical protein
LTTTRGHHDSRRDESWGRLSVMHSSPFRARYIAAVLVASAGLVVSACSSGSSGSTTPPPPTSAPPTSSSAPPPSGGSEPATGAGAIAAIKANWATFFNINTPTARRVALLQDGPALASVLAAQSKITLAQGSSAKVTKVTLTGAGQASVVYSILIQGHVALGHQVGVAVYQSGIWKVGLASFCGLLRLEAAVSSLHVPAVCPK